MEKFTRWIIKHRIWILGVFVLLIALSVVGTVFVKKQGDVVAYLKDDTDTMIGKQVLSDDFGIDADGSIAISYLTRDEVEKIVTRIQSDTKLDGILAKDPVWVGSFDDLEMFKHDGLFHMSGLTDENIEETLAYAASKFTKTSEIDGKTVTTYLVSIYFNIPGSDNRTIEAMDRIDQLVQHEIGNLKEVGVVDTSIATEDYYYVGGTAQNARSLVKSSLGDMPKFVIAAVVVVFLILLVTTRSYLEPLIFLATLGISILLNMGTNVIAGNPIGTISSITSSCAVILQLAIAMDYSIFLMHSYYEELRTTLDPKEAMVRALPKTIKSIAASSLTTVGGFVALFFMQYGIGYDLGFVLAKGVLLSLLSVVFLQPVLILMSHKFIEKTHHNWCVEPRLKFISKTITKLPIAIFVILLCVGIAIPSAIYQTKAPLNYITMTKENPDKSLPESIATDITNQLIIVVPYGGSDEIDKQYAFAEELLKIGENDASVNRVREVFSLSTLVNREMFDQIMNSPSKNLLYENLCKSFIAEKTLEDGTVERSMLYTIGVDGMPEDAESYATLDAVRTLAEATFGKVAVTGLSQGASDLSQTTQKDFTVVNVISALIIFIILLFTFRSPILAVILLMVIETGIWANLTLVYITGLIDASYQINFMAYLIVSSIELGATVDYAILFTSKYLEEKKSGMKSQAAIKNAVYRAAPGVITSAAILFFACLAVRLLTSNMIVSQITELIARGTIFSLILVFTLLPSVLSVKERISRSWRMKRGKGDPDAGKSDKSIYSVSSRKLAKLRAKGIMLDENGAAIALDGAIADDEDVEFISDESPASVSDLTPSDENEIFDADNAAAKSDDMTESNSPEAEQSDDVTEANAPEAEQSDDTAEVKASEAPIADAGETADGASDTDKGADAKDDASTSDKDTVEITADAAPKKSSKPAAKRKSTKKTDL